MSLIAAVGAKNRASRYLNDSFNPGETVGSGLRAGAMKDIAAEKYGAMSDYYAQTGQAQLDGIGKVGSAAAGAQQNAMIGGILGTIGGGLSPAAGIIKKQGLFGIKPSS